MVSNDASKNGIRLSVNDLGAGFKSNSLRYKVSFIVCKGSVDVTMSQVSLAMTLSLTTQTLSNGKVVPAFTVQDASVNIPKDHLHISIHGNYAAKMASAFKGIFMGQIRDEIQKQILSQVKSQLPKMLNSIVAEQNGYSELFNNLDLDWSLPSAPKVTDKELEFGVKGLFFKKGGAEDEPAAQAPAMPMHDTSAPSKFQAFISTYLADSLGATFLETNQVHLWTHSKDVPSSSPVQLTTTGLGAFIPGLVAHYGDNKPMDIEYNLDQVGNFSARESDSTLSFDGAISVNFWVELNDTAKEKAVAIELSENHFNFTILIKEGTTQLAMNVSEVALGGVHVNSTTFGALDLDLLAKLLNEGIQIGLPSLNAYLGTLMVQIPDELFGIFKLSDLTLKYHDNYLEAGLTPTFEPPSQDIPGIYEKFIPLTWEDVSKPTRYTTFITEEIDANDNYSYAYSSKFTWFSFFWEQMQLILQDYLFPSM